MNQLPISRRHFLEALSTAGIASALPALASSGLAGPSSIAQETLAPSPDAPPRYSIKFAVCGISHAHIYGTWFLLTNTQWSLWVESLGTPG